MTVILLDQRRLRGQRGTIGAIFSCLFRLEFDLKGVDRKMKVISGSTLAVALMASVGASILTIGAMKVFDRSEGGMPMAASNDRSGPSNPSDKADPVRLAEELKRLETALSSAEAERGQLAQSLRDMNQRINALNEQLAAVDAGSDAEQSPASPHTGSGFGFDDSLVIPIDPDRGRRDKLIAAGVDASTADNIEQRQNRYQLARLDLIDQAAREGWRESDEFDQRLAALDEERVDVREELGDEVYDRFLYEQGGSNRVGIDSVIGGSAAQLAGIRSGDMIVSYADGRVFKLPELQAATRSGARGESVQVTLYRDGELIAIDVPRGPLGVTLRRLRREPG